MAAGAVTLGLIVGAFVVADRLALWMTLDRSRGGGSRAVTALDKTSLLPRYGIGLAGCGLLAWAVHGGGRGFAIMGLALTLMAIAMLCLEAAKLHYRQVTGRSSIADDDELSRRAPIRR